MKNNFHFEKIPYGKGQLTLRIPQKNYLGTLNPNYQPSVHDENAEIVNALHKPIGTVSLKEIVGQKKGKQTVVVVNDGTRPTANTIMLPPLMEELENCGIADKDITILIATGTHRDVRLDEYESLYGKNIAERYRIINHNCRNLNNMIDLGITSQGIPIIINKHYCEADIKVLTGSIHPHQSAGFSGGRKSVLPGLTSLESLKLHHSFQFRPPKPIMGWLEGNPFHLAAMEAAKKAEPDFILNLVQNHRKEVIRAVAGDVEKAWLEGVRISRDIFEIKAPRSADIVVAVPGGHPRDVNLYQSQKALTTAEIVVKQGGTIILPAACPDGIGSKRFFNWLAAASRPEDVIERYKREEYNIGTSKAWMVSRCVLKADLLIVSESLDQETLEQMFAKKAPDLDAAIEMALKKQGKNAKILVMINAADMIPTF